jgi:hypothetical protein
VENFILTSHGDQVLQAPRSRQQPAELIKFTLLWLCSLEADVTGSQRVGDQKMKMLFCLGLHVVYHLLCQI